MKAKTFVALFWIAAILAGPSWAAAQTTADERIMFYVA